MTPAERHPVGLERRDQAQAEFVQQGRVASHMLEHRIDQQRLAGRRIAEQIGVGGRLGVEQLAKDEHGDLRK
jgi:hypothetical protein